MDPFRRQLRNALLAKRGEVLTPSACAWIEVASGSCAEPLPAFEGLGIDCKQKPEYLDFLNESTQSHLTSAEAVTIARLGTRDQIRAVVAFHDFERWSVDVTIASDGSRTWASPAFIRAVCSYPFESLGVGRVGIKIHEDNESSLNFCAHLGFRIEGLQPGRFGDHGAVLMGMLKRECRWIGGKP